MVQLRQGRGWTRGRGSTTEEKEGLVAVAALPGTADALQLGVGGG